MSEFTPWTKDEYIEQLQKDCRVFIAQRLEAHRENDRLKGRIEKLEAALQIYSCDCSLASEEEDCELGDWTMLSCGYRARKALEKKNA